MPNVAGLQKLMYSNKGGLKTNAALMAKPPENPVGVSLTYLAMEPTCTVTTVNASTLAVKAYEKMDAPYLSR